MNLINQILNIPLANAQIGNAAESVSNGTESQLAELIAFILTQIPLWITAGVILIATFFASKIAKRIVENKMAEKGLDEENKELQIIAGRGANMIVLVVGITAALGIVGIDLAPIVAAGAFGIGFAMKDLIMNMIAGMMILGAKHFKIGDTISVSGTTGKIVEIQTRATVIKAFDGTKVIVPNAQLFKNKVVNKWGNPARKVKIVVGVEYRTDLNLAMKCAKEAVANTKYVIKKPRPSVKLSAFGNYSINIMVAVWIDSASKKYMRVKNDLLHNLVDIFRQNNISFAFPTELQIKGEHGTETLPGGYKFDNEFKPFEKPETTSKEPESKAKPLKQPEPQLPVSPKPTINSDAQNWLQQAYIENTNQPVQPEATPMPAPQPAPEAQPGTNQ